jgi:hypothetical protein
MSPEDDTSPSPPDGQPSPGTGEKATDANKKEHWRRNGFVARKPKPIRDKINFMILDGLSYPKIVEALGDDGKDLNADHIGSWARGGHRDWLDTEYRADALRLTGESSHRLLEEKAGQPAQDAARTVAGTQLYELLNSFNPSSFIEAIEKRPELYLGIVNALSRLSEGEAACAHHRTQQSVLAAKIAAQKEKPKKNLLSGSELKDITREIKII